MDLPIIEINFFKRLKMLQLIKELDENYQLQTKYPGAIDSENMMPTWELEKKILYWSYLGHKHLQSPLTAGMFQRGASETKLLDFLITDAEMSAISGSYRMILKNLDQKGLAKYTDYVVTNPSINHSAVLTTAGLEMGAALWSFTRLQYSSTKKAVTLSIKDRYIWSNNLILFTSYVFYSAIALYLVFQLLGAMNGYNVIYEILLSMGNWAVVTAEVIRVVIFILLLINTLGFSIGIALISDIFEDSDSKIKEHNRIKCLLFPETPKTKS